MNNKKFFNLYHHGLIRVAVCSPEVRVAIPISRRGNREIGKGGGEK